MLDKNVYANMERFNSMVAELYSNKNKEKAIQDFLTSFKSYCFFEKGNVHIFRNDNNSLKYEDYIYIGWGNDLSTYMKYCELDDVAPFVSVSQSVLFRTSDIFVASERRKTPYYQNVLKPLKMDYSIEGTLYYENDFYCGFGLHRQESCGDFTDEEMMYVNLARPHLLNIIKAICKEKLYTSEPLTQKVNFKSDNVAVGVINKNYEFEMFDTVGNASIEANRENIQGTVISICRSLNSRMENVEIAEGTEFKDHCKVTIEDKSYYLDVQYEAPQSAEDEPQYTCMIYNYSNIIENIMLEMKNKYNLSDREYDVLTCLVSGLNNTDISDKLFISMSTVKKHTTTIYRKLDIEGRHQLMQMIM